MGDTFALLTGQGAASFLVGVMPAMITVRIGRLEGIFSKIGLAYGTGTNRTNRTNRTNPSILDALVSRDRNEIV